MKLLIIILLGTAFIWIAYKIYSFFTEISANSLDKDLPDSWTVVETNEKNVDKTTEVKTNSFVITTISDREMINTSLYRS
jgi:hypothetical protein